MSQEWSATVSGPVQLRKHHLLGRLPDDLTTLVVDMGGTTFDVEVTRGNDIVYAASVAMSGHHAITGVMRSLVRELPAGIRIDLAVIGSTGIPALDRRSINIRANLWWGVQNADELEGEFGFPVVFFNDLEVCGAGALASNEQELLCGPGLDSEQILRCSTIVLNHGTGLGVGRFISIGSALQVDHSEEGHHLLAVAPDDPEEIAMAAHLWQRVIRRMEQWGITVPPQPMQLEIEDALRVEDLFWALHAAGFVKPKPGTIELLKGSSSPIGIIVKLAMAEFENPGSGDPLCLHAMRKWVEFIARFAVHAQYGSIPRLVLAGDNVNSNLPYLRRWFSELYLRERYPHGALSSTRIVQVCTNRQVVFEGGRILASYLVSR